MVGGINQPGVGGAGAFDPVGPKDQSAKGSPQDAQIKEGTQSAIKNLLALAGLEPKSLEGRVETNPHVANSEAIDNIVNAILGSIESEENINESTLNDTVAFMGNLNAVSAEDVKAALQAGANAIRYAKNAGDISELSAAMGSLKGISPESLKNAASMQRSGSNAGQAVGQARNMDKLAKMDGASMVNILKTAAGAAGLASTLGQVGQNTDAMENLGEVSAEDLAEGLKKLAADM